MPRSVCLRCTSQMRAFPQERHDQVLPQCLFTAQCSSSWSAQCPGFKAGVFASLEYRSIEGSVGGLLVSQCRAHHKQAHFKDVSHCLESKSRFLSVCLSVCLFLISRLEGNLRAMSKGQGLRDPHHALHSFKMVSKFRGCNARGVKFQGRGSKA